MFNDTEMGSLKATGSTVGLQQCTLASFHEHTHTQHEILHNRLNNVTHHRTESR